MKIFFIQFMHINFQKATKLLGHKYLVGYFKYNYSTNWTVKYSLGTMKNY